MKALSVFIIGAFCVAPLPEMSAAEAEPSKAELWKVVKSLQAQAKKSDERVNALEKELSAYKTKAKSQSPSADKPKPEGKKQAGGESPKSGNSVFDRPIGSAAAFTALDVSPETISRPSTPRDFAASVLTGYDRNSKLQTGFALQATPYRWFGKVPRYDTEKGGPAEYFQRVLADTVLSLATTKASDGGKDVRLSLGLNFTLLDQPEQQLRTILHQAHDRAMDEYFGKPGWESKYTEAYEQIDKEIAKKKFTGYRLSMAWAPVWLSPSGNASSLKADGGAAFFNASYVFGTQKKDEPVADSEGYILVNPPGKERWLNITEIEWLTQLRYRYGEHVTDAKNSALSANQDYLLAAAGLRFGDDNWHVQFEGAYRQEWHGLKGDVGTVRLGGGFERRISKNLWFVLQVGNDFGSGKKKDELFSLGSFRFGSEDKPLYTDKK